MPRTRHQKASTISPSWSDGDGEQHPSPREERDNQNESHDEAAGTVCLGRRPGGSSLKTKVEGLEMKMYGKDYGLPEQPRGLVPRLDKMEKDLNLSVEPMTRYNTRVSRVDHYLIKVGNAMTAIRKGLFGPTLDQEASVGAPERGCGLRVFLEHFERHFDISEAVKDMPLGERIKVLCQEIGIET